ncbi:MAG: pyrroline-5-carboxylate reductase [Armatimonadetes bacterium]|nr:pyrroline-5-carboxylate reductase [Armatimonadota bacterium]
MLKSARIAFIGSGVMAEAILQGMLRQELITPASVTCSDPFPERGRELESRYGIKSTTSNREAVGGADIVILSVKPQVLAEVLDELRPVVRSEQLVISIVAGATTAAIGKRLAHSAIVRAMPNTPARIGEGMTVWIATGSVSQQDRARARAVFAALGEEVYMDHEEYLDMATALSGTGPAYIFMVMEALIDAGVHMGFSRRIAQQLVLQTMQGSVAFARSTDRHPAELRNAVTSPGGTSAEAIYQLEKGGLRTVISKAVYAAYQKSRLLSRLSEADPSHNENRAEVPTN